jgi:glutamate dehydrogenase/leucine dehydrogenase
MKDNKTKTDRLFDQFKQELQKTLEPAPAFGTATLTFHFMEGKVKRVVHKREESVIPGDSV